MTANVRTIRSVPLRLDGDDVPGTVELRGEVFFPLPAFERMNEEREEEGLPLYVNPRNTASGALRQLDSRVTASRPLDVLFYSVGHVEGVVSDSHWETLQAIRRWGGKVNEWTRRVSDIEGRRGGVPGGAEKEGGPRLRHRRDGGEDRQPGVAGAAGLFGQGPALGHGVQVPG